MRIALSFPGCHRRGGVERVMVECVNFLAGRGHEVHAFATEWDPSVLRPEVIRHDVPIRAWLPAQEVARFRDASARAIAVLRPDVTGSFGVAAPPGAVVWMQSVHAAWIEICRRTRPFPERLKQRLNPFHPLILRAERQLLAGRRYRRLIALTTQVREDLHRFYGVPATDADVLPNGFAGEEFNVENRRRDRAGMRRELDLPAEAKVIVFVANESERKGLPQLLRAVARLDDPALYVLAVGRFPAAPVLRLAGSLGLSARMRLPGASAQVAKYYAAADLFALPTQYEAWGLVIVEALACGLPVVVSRLAGAAAAVAEGENGQLLDAPRDEAELATKLAPWLQPPRPADDAAISRSVQRYEWSQVLRNYEAILAQAAEQAIPA